MQEDLLMNCQCLELVDYDVDVFTELSPVAGTRNSTHGTQRLDSYW